MGFRFSVQKTMPVFGAAMLMDSCAKKDWTCNCTVNGDKCSKPITNQTKSQAGKTCGNYGNNIGIQYGSYVYKCKVQ